MSDIAEELRSELIIPPGNGEAGYVSKELAIKAADELERLQAIVDKYPKTKDGVTVVPLMELWHPNRLDRPYIPLAVSHVKSNSNCPIGRGEYVEHLECYSTREAAEQGQERSQR